MNHRIIAACLVIASGLSWDAHAQVTAFGYTLGETTLAEVGDSGNLTGYNRYSGGAMVEVPAGRFGLAGLQEVLLIFAADETLSALVLTMDKGQFNTVHARMRERYAVRESRIPFVGDTYVRYGAPGATMEVDAPHLSFQMEVRYMRDEFVAAYKKAQREDAAEKRRRQRELF